MEVKQENNIKLNFLPQKQQEKTIEQFTTIFSLTK
jgi:hypothetical protein